MANYDDDYLYSDSGGAPLASPLLDQGGIGIQGPAPVEDRFVPPDPSGRQASAPLSDRDQFLQSRSTMGRLMLPFNEFAAAKRGQLSEFEKMQKEKVDKRTRDLKELETFSDITNKTFENADKLSGTDREKYVALQAKVLEGFQPGSGELLKSLADDPEYGKLVMKYAEKSSIIRDALQLGGIKKAKEVLLSEKTGPLARAQIEGEALPDIRTRLQTLGMAAQELMTPERYKKMQEDGFISPDEVTELNAAALAHPKYKAAALTEGQLNLAARYEDATYGMSGFATSKTKQDVLKKRGEQTVKGDKEAEYSPATVSVGGKNVSALVDKQGNYIDANTRQKISGVKPAITEADELRNRELAGRSEAVDNLEADVNTLENIAKKHPRSAAGLFSPVARGIEYVAGSLNPEGTGSTPGTTAVQLRDSILQRSGRLTRMTNADRERLENALQVGTGGNPRNLQLAIKILRDNIKKEKAEVGAGRARPQAGGGKKDYSGMSDEDLLKAISGG